jgi:hypothetical protein
VTADGAAHAAAALDPAGGLTPADANPSALVFRHVLQGRLEALFRPGERVLDLGGATGADASFLASRGVRAVGLDRLEGLAAMGSGFDGAYSTSGALQGADLAALGTALAGVLRPGAAVLLRLLGPWPLPGLLRRTLTGVGEGRRAPRAAGPPRLPKYLSLAEARRAMGPSLTWTDAYALGVLLPDPARETWVREHPQAFAALAMLERTVRRWPGLRQLGDQIVLEGRRAAPR